MSNEPFAVVNSRGIASNGAMAKKLRFGFFGLLTALGLLLVTAWAVLRLPAFGGNPAAGSRLERLLASPEYVHGRFENDPPENTDHSLWNNLRQYQDQRRTPDFEIPVVPLAPLPANVAPGLRAVWFGHATVLVEIDGLRILTDPMLSDYASPLEFGPRRLHPPPLALAELDHIDAVVISHDHYDHLDMKTVKHLAAQGTQFYVGLGIGAHLERWEVPAAQVHEMDWWESLELKGVKVHCTPARHYSGRRWMDNSTLWASWFVKGPRHSFYFSGDTGYGPHFQRIHDRLGSPDLALMKIGAYGATWLDIHMDPEWAVRAFRDLEARVFLPVHWATFNLAYHAWAEPIERTVAAARERSTFIVTPRVGEIYDYATTFASAEWWKKP